MIIYSISIDKNFFPILKKTYQTTIYLFQQHLPKVYKNKNDINDDSYTNDIFCFFVKSNEFEIIV